MDLYFLTLEDVLEIHADQIKRYGGSKGLRDQNLLLSAIAQPHMSFVCQNHPFIDGNKRVAAVSALVFLVMNDQSIDFSEKELEKLVRSIAERRMKKEAISVFLSNGLG